MSADHEYFVKAETRAKFDELVASAEGKPVFVDFFATWCGKCEHSANRCKAVP